MQMTYTTVQVWDDNIFRGVCRTIPRGDQAIKGWWGVKDTNPRFLCAKHALPVIRGIFLALRLYVDLLHTANWCNHSTLATTPIRSQDFHFYFVLRTQKIPFICPFSIQHTIINCNYYAEHSIQNLFISYLEVHSNYSTNISLKN